MTWGKGDDKEKKITTRRSRFLSGPSGSFECGGFAGCPGKRGALPPTSLVAPSVQYGKPGKFRINRRTPRSNAGGHTGRNANISCSVTLWERMSESGSSPCMPGRWLPFVCKLSYRPSGSRLYVREQDLDPKFPRWIHVIIQVTIPQRIQGRSNRGRLRQGVETSLFKMFQGRTRTKMWNESSERQSYCQNNICRGIHASTLCRASHVLPFNILFPGSQETHVHLLSGSILGR